MPEHHITIDDEVLAMSDAQAIVAEATPRIQEGVKVVIDFRKVKGITSFSSRCMMELAKNEIVEFDNVDNTVRAMMNLAGGHMKGAN